MNGGYDVDNDDAIFSSDNGESKNLDKCEDSDNLNKDSDMEVDSEEVDSGHGANNLAAPVTDGTSVDNDVGSGEVSDNNKECKNDSVMESMDVDAQSNASDDVECIGDDKEDEEEEDGGHGGDASNDLEGDENDSVSESNVLASSTQKLAEEDEGDRSAEQNDRSIEILSQGDSNAKKNCEENGSVGSPEVEEITDGEGKSNGHNTSTDSLKETPKKKNKKAIDLTNVTPRRSSRNVNRKSYTERDLGNLSSFRLLCTFYPSSSHSLAYRH